ncbi:MAG: SPOR domain-containing protein [Flavobacteriaceae bacterium]|nr:SPOR domain-containing protein [Flavobacteriaceae bacterium]
MKNTFKAFFFSFFLGFTADFSAQIETQTEQIGDAELITTMDKRIRNTIENLEESCKKTTQKKGNISRNTTANPSNVSTTKELTTAEICKKNPRILGYKIQVAVVKNKEEADKIRVDFRNQFPTIKVEIDASLRPNYRILAGSYFSRESANPDLRRIRIAFSSATAVQYRVFCTEAK